MHGEVLNAGNGRHLAFDELGFLGLNLLFGLNVLSFPLLLYFIHSLSQDEAFVSVGVELIGKALFLRTFSQKLFNSFFNLLIFSLEFFQVGRTVFCLLDFL